MRNLDDALKRAESLRDFRATNSERFERNQDFLDIVLLADAFLAVTARDAQVNVNALAALVNDPTRVLGSIDKAYRDGTNEFDDHDESW